MPPPRIHIGTIRIERIGISLICGGAPAGAIPIVIVVCVMNKDTVPYIPDNGNILNPSGTGSHRCIGEDRGDSIGCIGGDPVPPYPGEEKPHNLACKELKPHIGDTDGKIIFQGIRLEDRKLNRDRTGCNPPGGNLYNRSFHAGRKKRREEGNQAKKGKEKPFFPNPSHFLFPPTHIQTYLYYKGKERYLPLFSPLFSTKIDPRSNEEGKPLKPPFPTKKERVAIYSNNVLIFLDRSSTSFLKNFS